MGLIPQTRDISIREERISSYYHTDIYSALLWNTFKVNKRACHRRKARGSWVELFELILGIMLYPGCLMFLREVFLLKTIHITPHKPLWLNVLWKSLSVPTGLLGRSCLLICSGTKPWVPPSIPAMVNIVGAFISNLEVYSCSLQLSSSVRDCSTKQSSCARGEKFLK